MRRTIGAFKLPKQESHMRRTQIICDECGDEIVPKVKGVPVSPLALEIYIEGRRTDRTQPSYGTDDSDRRLFDFCEPCADKLANGHGCPKFQEQLKAARARGDGLQWQRPKFKAGEL